MSFNMSVVVYSEFYFVFYTAPIITNNEIIEPSYFPNFLNMRVFLFVVKSYSFEVVLPNEQLLPNLTEIVEQKASGASDI